MKKRLLDNLGKGVVTMRCLGEDFGGRGARASVKAADDAVVVVLWMRVGYISAQ